MELLQVGSEKKHRVVIMPFAVEALGFASFSGSPWTDCRLYFGFASGDTSPAIAVSNDRGLTWSNPVDVGATFGINNVVFPAVVAGDDDRAAFAFYGTPTAGSLQAPRFQGVWHLYVAHTYDGGATWTTVDVTPNDPMQRGCIWLGGGSNICRNMLDFMGADVDKRGRVLVGYNDGCAGAECSQARPGAVGNSYTSFSAIARQTGGKSLFVAQDGLFPDAPTAPGAPYLTALRNGITQLQWSVSNDGGAAVNSFTIERATAAAGPFTAIATVPGTQLRYIDTAANPADPVYFYRVSAANVVGASCGSNQVPAPFVGSSASAEGYRIALDPTGDHKDAPSDPDLDVQSLSISEPATGPNAGKLVFNMKLAGPPTGNEKKWRIIWNSPNAIDKTRNPPVDVGQFYVGLFTDSTGQVRYDYGTVQTAVVGFVLGVPQTRPAGTPDAGSFTPAGLVTIVVSRDKIGDVKIGDLMGRFSVRTYRTPESNFVRSTDAIDTTGNAAANDFTANALTYQVAGPIPGLDSVVSRKMHGTISPPFDIDMPLAGTPGVEMRNNGSNSHQIVFRFAQPVTFSTASVTPASGKTATVSSTSDPATASSEVIVNLSDVTNIQTLTVSLQGVTGLGATPINIGVPVAFLMGDVNQTRTVDGNDVSAVQGKTRQLANGATFKADINYSGRIDGNDVSLTQAKTRTALP